MISPLNWGLGHASRDIAVINALLEMNHMVYIGGSGDSIDYLKEYYPESMFVHIDSPKIKYGKRAAIGPGFAISFLGFFRSIYSDYFSLKRICKTHKFDLIISDNRLGLYSKKIKSLYITHQVNVKTRKPNSLSGKIVKAFHHKYINKFDYCLIPDNENENTLAGELAHVIKSDRFKYTGVLSRFDSIVQSDTMCQEFNSNILVLISGPEPQRSFFEEAMIKKLQSKNNNVIIVRGIVGQGDAKIENKENFIFYNNPSDETLFDLLRNSAIIFCRSGYSTLMDLAVCKRKAVLIPTPGQPEQEYLAMIFKKNFQFLTINQNEIEKLNLSEIDENEKWDYPFEPDKLKKVLALCLD